MTEIQKRGYYIRKGELTLVEGAPLYEYLKVHDPKKLRRLMKQEMAFYMESHTPGYEERVSQEIDELRAWKEQSNKKKPDYQMLGLDQVDEKITKRVVTNAYRRKARKAHPDAGGDAEAFKSLHEAYRRVLAAAPKE